MLFSKPISGAAMLEFKKVSVAYGQARVLQEVSFTVPPGSVTCLMGRNGAGKTTMMKAAMGLVPLLSGQIRLNSIVLNGLLPHKVPGQGIAYVPQGRRLFPELTVEENIEIGLMAGGHSGRDQSEMFALFPRLSERRHQQARTLSGGEQQMLATARALALDPDYLLLDEPTEGLQPSMIELIRSVIGDMRDRGVGILLVEQRVDAVLGLADKVGFLENGHLMKEISAANSEELPRLLRRYVGVVTETA